MGSGTPPEISGKAGGDCSAQEALPSTTHPHSPARRLFLAVCGTFVGPTGQERNKREGGGGDCSVQQALPFMTHRNPPPPRRLWDPQHAPVGPWDAWVES